MGLFGLVFVAVALVLIGVGFAIGVFACAITIVLLALGVVSSSVFVGICSGRTAAGIRVFLLQCGVFMGVFAGAGCSWLAESFFERDGSLWPVLAYGAAGGAFAGVVIAMLLEFIWRRFATWSSSQVTLHRNELEAPSASLQRTRSAVPSAATELSPPSPTSSASGAPAPRISEL